MTNKRIKELVDFFYSSNSAEDVPLRISIIIGRCAGYDLSSKGLYDLLVILNKSKNLKEDMMSFIRTIQEEE